MKQIITQHGWALNKHFWDDYKVDFLNTTWQPLSEPELVAGFESLLAKFSTAKSVKVTLHTDVGPNFELKKANGSNEERSKGK